MLTLPRTMTHKRSVPRGAVVVHDHFSMPGGGERTALALRAALDADLWTGFVCGTPARRLVAAELDRLRTLSICMPVPLVRTLLLSTLMARIPLHRYELAVLSGNSAPCALLGTQPTRSLVYCHAPPRYLFDQREILRRRVPGPLRPLADRLLDQFERRYRAALARCDTIAVNSFTVRSRVRRYLGLDAVVVHPPVDTSAFRWLEGGDYFVSTARVAPLKRVEAIVRAFLRLPQQRLIVLSGGSDAQRLRRLAAGAHNIEFTGWVPDRMLSDLIGRCRATIYVPVDEDFGLSPLESMAAGKPVIGVREGGLRETVVHDKTGLLLEPNFNIDALCDAVGAMTAARARAMRGGCEARAQQFSVSHFRQRLANALAGWPPHAPADAPVQAASPAPAALGAGHPPAAAVVIPPAEPGPRSHALLDGSIAR
jgi:glycosyltransferase involved in cell wall biosynthesis